MERVYCALLLIAALVATALAQAQQSEPIVVKWKDSAEYSAYMAVYSQTIAVNRASSAEKFLTEHRDANPAALTTVYKAMFLSYVEMGNWSKVIDTYNRQSLAPNLTEADKQQFEKLTDEARAKLK